MNIKSLVSTAVAIIAFTAGTASASTGTILSDPINGSTFTDVSVGTIHIGSVSDLGGSFFAATSIQFPSFSLTLQSVTFLTSSGIAALTDLDPSANGFSFQNVAAGDYLVKASGFLSGSAQIPNLAFVGANYSVTAVPEPEAFAMLLAGLGLVGTIARRRKMSAAASA